MTEGSKQFENASDDCSNVAETYLEPIRLNLEDMPDYARLEKPRRPPVPEVSVHIKCTTLYQLSNL